MYPESLCGSPLCNSVPSVVKAFFEILTTEDTELHRGKTHRKLFTPPLGVPPRGARFPLRLPPLLLPGNFSSTRNRPREFFLPCVQSSSRANFRTPHLCARAGTLPG